ncbi:MAG: carboxypeptidase-like regulatory domain-containing protein [Phycisphaerales bacterium]
MMRMTQLLSYSLLVSTAAGLSGCSSYVLHGKVIAGPISHMAFVGADDNRLGEAGIDGVQVTVRRDPGRLSTQLVASAITDLDGNFSLAVDELGAGWMEEEWLLVARKPGFQNATWQQRLTMKHPKLQLLVTMTPGYSEPDRHEDLMDQYEQFRRPTRWMPRLSTLARQGSPADLPQARRGRE